MIFIGALEEYFLVYNFYLPGQKSSDEELIIYNLTYSTQVNSTEINTIPIPNLEIIEKIDKYEPRVEVDDIEFEYNGEGRMIPKVYFKKREANDEED